MLSIGIGGHVEECPSENMELLEVLTRNMAQETSEEIGVDLEPVSFISNLALGVVIVDSRLEVEKVHCGLSVIVRLNKDTSEMVFEKGTIEQPKWMTVAQIQKEVASGAAKLEKWTELVIKHRFIEH
jgi:predicted NUDIX family phosphoesterase